MSVNRPIGWAKAERIKADDIADAATLAAGLGDVAEFCPITRAISRHIGAKVVILPDGTWESFTGSRHGRLSGAAQMLLAEYDSRLVDIASGEEPADEMQEKLVLRLNGVVVRFMEAHNAH